MKKRNFIYVLVCLFFSFSTFAGDRNLNIPHAEVAPYDAFGLALMANSEKLSPFDQLAEYFHEAEEVSPSEVLGWTSGRCFNDHSPDQPGPGLLVGVEYVDGLDRGPLFPNRSEFKHAVLDSLYNANYYDQLNDHKARKIKLSIEKSFDDLSASYSENDSMVSLYKPGNIKFKIRKFEQYILSELVVIQDTEKSKAGDKPSYCYFFKRVFDY
tara:strand:+ start:7744 stop:8379 length:636 start_codon:yes stop_codon:yes gene_type:complete